MSDEEEAEYGLVMPFVVCEDQGGPYRAKDFVAGAYMGSIDTELKLLAEVNAQPLSKYVPTPLVPQIDLVAMRHGYVMRSEEWDEHPDEWTRVDFYRPNFDDIPEVES